MDAFEHLPQYSSNGVLVETSWTLIKIVQHSMIDELEHQIQMFLATEHFYQIHQVLVS